MTNTSQTDPLLGRLIDGRYQVRSRIARGGMATVYLATDLRLERRVALKVMHSHLADDTNFRSRFVQEARSTARLAHPNVVNVFDQGQDDDMAYLVMEYLPGITLRDLLRDYGKLTPEQTIDIMENVLAGLAAAHRAGIVHRDLKPENVLLADDGRIKLGDFGLARAAANATGTGQALLGTIAYLSPELVTRGIADTRSDIYAIGIMIYEMLTGEQPFQGEQPMQIAYQHANDSVPRPSLKNPLVPPQLDDLVLWATSKDPEQRPADARALLDKLYEVEHAIHAAPAEPGLDATRVIPPTANDTLATTVLAPAAAPLVPAPQFAGPAAQVRSEATATDAVSKLAAVGRHRRGRGWWLLAALLVVAGAAGGTGWYFGAGPGALVAVPALVEKTADAATAALKNVELVGKQNPVYSCAVPEGHVARVRPEPGRLLHKGSTVTIDVSRGHEPNQIPKLGGLPAADAKRAITDAKSLVGTQVDQQFSSSVANGAVIAATKASDNTDITGGGPYTQCDTVNLVISVGPVPDVVGQPLADAQAAIKKAGLAYGQGQSKYDDTVPKGAVISQEPANSGPVHLGDTILLDVSQGPQLYPVPDVTGMTPDDAKQTLTKAGFTVTVPNTFSGLPIGVFANGMIVVSKEDPPASDDPSQKKGTNITLTLGLKG
ncbi:Stk1 family PASTA domain-containing Ser/Thr kinase [Gryllotalpicola protaetiae]|uniref:Stk1 family PASTA domain-containing Ser/Thr kinase n=1 Tax=Gryllotalpicola protaetiae TaxID=2419771 RepID=UPI001FE66DD0|nr:Stk1 family PASTA domain-containing Ser/Thr kinase [Gryllotalpicola protaetiae]